ncbi:MAG TPA: acid phosphatase, partial [Gammaproteobacteria bacterium]|nr:acid phosphatase [Gammaproteobacteria bacterium]
MTTKTLKTGVTAALLLSALVTSVSAAEPQTETDRAELTNPLLYAMAWRQTAAEFRALYYQGFALAQLRVEQALAAREAGAENDTRPLAVITDVDETVLLSGAYWGQLIAEGGDFFDD